LKELIPAWMCAVFDPRHEISMAATEALRSTIPAAKHADTINFVRLGILEYVESHLTTLFDAQGALLNKEPSAEEDSETFGRIVATNVQLLTHMVETLSVEEFAKLTSKFSDLMDLHIWRLQKALDPKIRAELYSLMAALLRHTAFIGPHLEATSKIILASISDANPKAQAKAWGAVISLFSQKTIFAAPWFNLKKLFLPSLLQSIKSTDATEATYHALLPLLSTLPVEQFSQFFNDALFSELWKALKHETTIHAVIGTYFDCLIYVIVKLQPEMQQTLLDTHFLPIFAGFFTYAKEIAPNITHAMALFISRLEAKRDIQRSLVSTIWSKLENLTKQHFLLGSEPALAEESKNQIEASNFSEKLGKFMVQLEVTRAETKQTNHFEGFINFFTLLLAPTLQHLYDKGLMDQISCISSLGAIWRSIDSLTMVQERKKAEAAEFLVSHPNAPSFITDLVSSPLKSSLRTSTDNSEWQYLLKGLIQQWDMISIQNFMSHEVHDPSFWQCPELNQLALDLATFDNLSLSPEHDAKKICILPFLIKFLPQEVLDQLAPLLTKSTATEYMHWTIPFIENITASIAALCEAHTDSATDLTMLLNSLFSWALAPCNSLKHSLRALLHDNSMQALDVALPALAKSRENLNFDMLVFLVRDHISTMMKSAEESSKHEFCVKTMSNVVGRISNSLIQIPAFRRTGLDLLARLMLTEDEWVFVTTALKSQRKSDVFAHNPLGESDEACSQSRSTVLESAAALLSYSIHALSRFDQLEAIASSELIEGEENVKNFAVDVSQFTSDQCDMRIISEISHLMVCDFILSSSPSVTRDTSASQTLKTISRALSEFLRIRAFPSILLLTPSGIFQLVNHVISTYASSSLAAIQVEMIFNFLSNSSLYDAAKTKIFETLWKEVFSVNAKRAALLSSFKLQKWTLYLQKSEVVKNTISKYLSDLYQLKPSMDGSLPPVSSNFGLQFLTLSVLLPAEPTVADKRKVFEIYTFASKSAFSILDEETISVEGTTFLVGLIHFMVKVILNSQFDWKLSEANYAVLFDLTQKIVLKSKPTTPLELNAIGYNAMMLLDALAEHMFSEVKVTNADWADFINDTIGPLCQAWTNLSRTAGQWPESYLRRWARVMRLTTSHSVLRLEGTAISQLNDIIRFSTDLRTQCSTYLMALSVIKDHNANTYTKTVSSSAHHHSPSSESSSSLSDVKDDILDSKVIPDNLQQILLDVTAGYLEPLHVDEIDLESSDDAHMYLVSASVCASTLLGWRLTLEHLNSRDEKEKNDVSSWIRQSGLLSLLVPLLCHLVDLERPPSISSDVLLVHYLQSTAYGDLKTDLLDISKEISIVNQTIQGLALYLLRDLFELVPVLMRSWWQHSDSELRAEIEIFASKFISPQLVSKELSRVSGWKPENPLLAEDFSVKATSIGEVIASYRKDEVELSLTLKLASSHPLKPVTVSMNHKAVSEALWRKWLLSMRSLLLTRDGSLLDAVLLWRDYLDQHFEGVECCPICYAIFHISNYSLPDLACKTCKNKFHKACLYKWFNTSHHIECPLCKTPFN